MGQEQQIVATDYGDTKQEAIDNLVARLRQAGGQMEDLPGPEGGVAWRMGSGQLYPLYITHDEACCCYGATWRAFMITEAQKKMG